MAGTRRGLLRASAAASSAALIGLAAAACRPPLPWPRTKVTPTLALTVAVPTGGVLTRLNEQVRDAIQGALLPAAGARQGRFTLALTEVAQPPWEPNQRLQSQTTIMAPLLGAGDPPDLLVFTSWASAGQVGRETRSVTGMGWLQPLDDFLKGDRALALGEFLPAALDLCRRRGQLVALPLTAVPQMLAYDAHRFAQAGVGRPTGAWDWRRFEEAARRLTRDTNGDGTPDEYGFSPGMPAPAALAFLWQNGGDAVSADRKSAMLAEPAALEAVEFLAGLYREPPAIPRARLVQGLTSPDGIQHNNVWCAMTHAPLWVIEGERMGVTELPQGRRRATALAVTATLSVSHKAKDPAVAAAALAAMAERATKELVPPPRRLPPQTLQALDPRLTPEGAQALANSLGYSRSAGLGDMEKAEAVFQVLSDDLVLALAPGTRTPAEAAQRANDAIQRILDRPY